MDFAAAGPPETRSKHCTSNPQGTSGLRYSSRPGLRTRVPGDYVHAANCCASMASEAPFARPSTVRATQKLSPAASTNSLTMPANLASSLPEERPWVTRHDANS